MFLGIIAIAILIIGCDTSPATGRDGTLTDTVFAYDESLLDNLLVNASRGLGVSYTDFDNLILPPDSRAIKIDSLGKWVFGNEYVDTLASFGGTPYLELFPVFNSPTGEVDEVRIEKTSYYKFRSLYAGNWNDDIGSALNRVTTVLGAPDTTSSVSSLDNIDWSARGTLFLYPISDTKDGGYIHYDFPNDVKVRIFLGGQSGETLHILSMYFPRTL